MSLLQQRILDGMVEDGLRDARIDTIRKATKLAAEHGHDRVIQVLLENDISPIYGDEDQSSYYPQDPLSIAVSCGHESVTRVLLAHGAGKNIMRRLLFCAAEKGYLSIFKSFVETYNCNPESRDPSGRTALAVAALNGQVEITQYLLKLGARPNSRDYKCYTPIYHAAGGDNIQIISLLLEYGAHIDPKMPDGRTMYPICHAIKRNSFTTRKSIETARFILEHMDLNNPSANDNGQGVLLCVAAACGSEALVKQLLERGCHPDATQLTDRAPFERVGTTTALMWATEFGHEKIVRLLLEKGADPNHKNLQQDPVLAKAIPLGLRYTTLEDNPYYAIFKLLLEHGADPTADHRCGRSVLELLLISGETTLVRMLLNEDLKLPPEMIKDNSRLLCFATAGGVTMLEFLFQSGFEPPPPGGSDGDEAVYRAILRKDLQALKFLLDKGYLPIPYRQSYVLDCAVETGEIFLDLLLSHGVDLHRDHDRVCTWYTIYRRNAFDLRILLNKGADPLPRDYTCHSRLQQAALYGFAEGVEVLLEYLPTTYMKHSHSHDDVKRAVLKALEIAVAEKHWKCVRLLHRFYHCDLPTMEVEGA